MPNFGRPALNIYRGVWRSCSWIWFTLCRLSACQFPAVCVESKRPGIGVVGEASGFASSCVKSTREGSRDRLRKAKRDALVTAKGRAPDALPHDPALHVSTPFLLGPSNCANGPGAGNHPRSLPDVRWRIARERVPTTCNADHVPYRVRRRRGEQSLETSLTLKTALQ